MPKGFQKGNTEARKKGKHKKTIRQEEVLKFIQDEIRKELIPILTALIEKCKMGDMVAIKEALDRLAGKPKGSLDIPGGALASIIINILSQETAKAKKRIEEKNGSK